MQIRLTVLGPPAGGQGAGTGPGPLPPGAVPRDAASSGAEEPTVSCDVLVTAPSGTALAAVTGSLVAVAASCGVGPGPGGSSDAVAVYAGAERLDPHRRVLGEPPLLDGAVLSLAGPAEAAVLPPLEGARALLRVIAGPDAGGVHLLRGGEIQIGRSAGADVPLDDPDVSRLHCTVTVTDDGGVLVTDLDSTNGTTIDGAAVGSRPTPLQPGAVLRLGESALGLEPVPAGGGALPLRPGGPRTAPDHEGQLRLAGQPAVATPDTGAKAGRQDLADFRPGPVYGGEAAAAESAAPHPAPGRAFSAGPPGNEPADELADGPGDEPGDEPADNHGVPAAGAPRPRTGRPARPEARQGSTGSSTGSSAGGSTGSRAGSRAGATGTGAAPTAPAPPEPSAAARHPAPHSPTAGPGAGADSARTPAPTGSEQAAGVRPVAATTSGSGAAVPGGPVPVRPPDRGSEGSGNPLPHTSGAEPIEHERTADQGRGEGTRSPAGDDCSGVTTHHVGRARPGAGEPVREQPRRTRIGAGIGAWARRFTGAATRSAEPATEVTGSPGTAGPAVASRGGAPAAESRSPDPATVLLTALGPGPRLWERDPRHRDALTVRLGTAQRSARSAGPLTPVTVALRSSGSLGLAGPRPRLAALARSLIAQLATLHPPDSLELVLIAADPARDAAERIGEWSWVGWLPHVRPARGQDCRLLLALDRDQAAARIGELVRRLDEGPLGPGWAAREPTALRGSRSGELRGPATVLIVDGDPGSSALRERLARMAACGPADGIHLLCLAETPAATPSSPLTSTLRAAHAATPGFSDCGAAALLSGAVATAVRILPQDGTGTGTVATVDGVSLAWAERLARALAPLRTSQAAPGPRPAAALPTRCRLLDELGLARATPAALLARWAEGDGTGSGVRAAAGRAVAVLGTGSRGTVTADLALEGTHLYLTGGPGSGKTELLRSLAAALAAGDRPDRLGLLLVDGGGATSGSGSGGGSTGTGTGGDGSADGPEGGLGICGELPHVVTRLAADDPVRMREFAQALGGELKRRSELLGSRTFEEYARGARSREAARAAADGPVPAVPGGTAPAAPGGDPPQDGSGRNRGALKLREYREEPEGCGRTATGPGPEGSAAPALPRLAVLVDDFDTLVSPGLGNPGRPAAGSVVRALEAVAREGARLGVHLIAASGRPESTEQTAAGREAALRVVLGEPERGAAEQGSGLPGRGVLHRPDGTATAFQAGRVTGRIPRTSTLRPTAVPLDWSRAGDPPARRPVRELGNGPTDLALLASALDRAARSAGARPVPPLV